MDNDIFNLVLVFLLLAIVSFLFIRIAIRTRKFGGSMTTNLLGATFDFMDKDKRKSAMEIVERKSQKKFSEDNSGET